MESLGTYDIKINRLDSEGNIDSNFSIKIPQDFGISEWAWLFKTILTWATFYPETIKEIIREEDEDFPIEGVS